MADLTSSLQATSSSLHETQILFRKEILLTRRSQWVGAIRLAQPASTWVIASISLLIAASLVAYITLGTMRKKARVAGIVIPSSGSLSISTPNGGLLVHRYIEEGQEVKQGEVLFELSTERLGNLGEITALVSQQLAIRNQSLIAERRSRISQTEEKQRALNAREVNLNAEFIQLEQEISLASRRKELAQKSLGKFETLQDNGFVSAAQTQQKQEDLIDLDARLSSLARTKVQLDANRLAIKSDRETLAGNLATDLVQLDRTVASLNQEIAENQNRNANWIIAPEDGTVTTVTNQVGQAVSNGQVLATLIPRKRSSGDKSDSLEVDLYAPSRTAGFIAAGQTVLIRYQAFPYQKFGLHEGVVIDVSTTPFAPNELPSNLASTILSNAQQSTIGYNTNEAMYRIKVKLAHQWILAYGKEQPLKPGMTLEADIVQDERKLWEWILEPILAVAHR